MSETIDFTELLKLDPSRRNIDYVSYLVGNDKEAFKTVFELAFHAPHPVNQRAAGVVETITRDSPGLLTPIFLDRMIASLADFKIDGVKRCFLKIFIRTNFTEDQHGLLLNLCFNFIQNKKESIATRVFSMQILYNISQFFPEIKKELILIIESEMQIGSPAWRSRGTHLLRKLYKEIRE